MTNDNELTITEWNMQTGEVVERPLTEAELAQVQIDREDHKALLAKQAEEETAAKAKADAKAAVLEKLGLTQDIIDILVN